MIADQQRRESDDKWVNRPHEIKSEIQVGQHSVDIIAFHTAKSEHGSPREVPKDSAAENA